MTPRGREGNGRLGCGADMELNLLDPISAGKLRILGQ